MTFKYNPPNCHISVIFEDEELLVIDKPAGLLSVPGRSAEHKDSLIERLKKRHKNAKIVHRLDMDTSGLMVIALNVESHRNLSIQFQDRLIVKKYIADIMGNPLENMGIIDQPLRCDWENRPLQMIDHDLGKPSKTKWQILKRNGDSSRIELIPVTGRSHQLRVHCQYMGHPILGDRFYAPVETLKGHKRMHLHAFQLGFTHPVSGKDLLLESPIPF